MKSPTILRIFEITIINNIIITNMIHQYDTSMVAQLMKQHYGLVGTITQMAGYTDKNFIMKTQREGILHKYIIKISSSLQNKHLINLQNYVFKQLQINSHLFNPCAFPTLLQTLSNQQMFALEKQGKQNFFRVLRFIEGQQIWQIEDPALHLFTETGDITAKLSLFLSKLNLDYKLKEQIIVASIDNYFNICKFSSHYQKYYQYLDNKLKPFISNVHQEFNLLLPTLQKTPKQIIHNDICLSNLLVKNDKQDQHFVCGIIDFGDIIYSYAIIELVILCARINLYKPDPLRNIMLIIVAYNKVKKLSSNEIQLLFPLIKARLAFLCLVSSYIAYEKDDHYLLKCKNGHILYFETIANHCTNEAFLQRLEKQINE